MKERIKKTLGKTLIFGPLIIYGNILLNIIFNIFLPNTNDNVRKYIVYGILAVIMVCYLFLINYKDKTLWYYGAIILIFGIFYTVFLLIRNDGDVNSSISRMISEYFMTLFMIITFYAVYSLHEEKKFLKICGYYSMLMAAFSIGFCIYHFATGQISIGDVVYMPIAYMLLGYMVFLFVYVCEDYSKLKFCWIIGAFITIGIVGTECKGAILSDFLGCLGVSFYYFAFKKGKRMIGIMSLSFVLGTIGVAIIGLSSSRIGTFFNEVVENNIDVDNSSKVISDNSSGNELSKKKDKFNLQYYYNSIKAEIEEYNYVYDTIIALHPSIEGNNEKLFVHSVYIYTYLDKDYQNGLIDTKDYDRIKKNTYVIYNSSIGGRLLLYSRAIKHTSEKPITGNGLGFYQKVYKTYPHNTFLEVMVDFGILGLLWEIAILVIVIRMALMYRKTDNNNLLAVTVMIFYLFMFGERMVSGSFYAFDGFFLDLIILGVYVKERIRLKQIG